MISIQLMKAEDVKEAAMLEAACFSQPWSEQSFLDAVNSKNALYLIAKMDGQFVGMCGLWQALDEADVMNVAVDPKFRGQGIAAALLTELFRMGEKRGIAAFTLEVRSSNRAAISLYEKLGFVTEGVRRNFYEMPQEDALIMWKR